MKFIDSHSHLNFPAYDEDRDGVIERMRGRGVGSIDVGTTLATSRAAAALAQKHDFIWAAVGIHPGHASAERFYDKNELKEKPVGPEKFDGAAFRELLEDPRVVAIGECGLDYHYPNHDKEAQKALFVQHLVLSRETDKPLIIHCRDAYDDLHKILEEHKGLRGTIHFYTGPLETARKFIDLGFFISFSGVITFADEYEPLVRELPLDKILIETDCPYASPVPYRGKRNEPAYVVEVAKKIAELKNISLDEVAEQTTRNTRELFNL